MQQSLRPYWLSLLAVWTILIGAAIVYSQIKHIPSHIAIAVVPAFLVEAAFYLASGMESVRFRLENLPKAFLALGLVLSAPVPYLIYSLPLGRASFVSFGAIIALAAVPSFWYLVVGRSRIADLSLLAVMATVILWKVFAAIYPEPAGRLGLPVLGQAMWIRLGVISILCIRQMEGIGFSFVPRGADWRIGIVNYVIFLPVGMAAAFLLDFSKPGTAELGWKTIVVAPATFLGILWVVALSEEFFFRGVLQQHLHRMLSSNAAAIAVASILFGLAHLGFGGRFPNWKFVVLATLAGVFYGRAYAQARNIRAAMVTHALVVTTWRVLL